MDSQRRIIDIFINAIFVYDDKVTITFNYSGDNRTITLMEVDAAAQGVYGLSGMGHQGGRQTAGTSRSPAGRMTVPLFFRFLEPEKHFCNIEPAKAANFIKKFADFLFADFSLGAALHDIQIRTLFVVRNVFTVETAVKLRP